MPRRISPLTALVSTLAFLFILTALLGQTAQPAFAQSTEPSASPDSAEESSAPSATEKTKPKTPAWEKNVDAFFGKWFVAPMDKVLFYDFRSGPWVDSEGNDHDGWAGTSIPFVVAWLFVGAIFFTIRMGFINFRAFWHSTQLVRGIYDDPNETGEVSHFQALSSALSATVGLGNIAGVAIAIGTGGPGATLWIVLVGLLGMTSKFTECTLGQMYRKVAPDGTVSGGAMHYLRDGLAELNLKPLQ